ncbi:6432_t:CDS:2 [Diversispora eburnea]|uniref:6432_t:CDS:1 n=1 Tax=Diversispora eburnea TaxID=1213867 RepID=A0A9N8YYL0_9GLOM|nr:6432_t:CDS:2 [Diversispora eburnea]
MSSPSPPLSPPSNNRNPIKSEFFIDPNSTTTSESYSGTTEYLNRDSSVSSRKSQQSLGLVERLKLGISHPIVIEDDNDLEGLR